MILKGCGVLVAPTIPSVRSSTPAGAEKWNFWSKVTKNKKSSILARLSPRHARFPEKMRTAVGISMPTQDFYAMINGVDHLQRRAETLPSWGTFHPHQGSVRGWRCLEFPTPSGRTARRWGSASRLCPAHRNNHRVCILYKKKYNSWKCK